jgi:Cof subfamily protein (haloacid dehalogenase superfamily)
MSATYRLIALDVDGTTVEGGQLPNTRMRRAVAEAVGRGVHVLLATGRPFLSARRYAEAFDLRSPLICFQWALVKEMAGGHASLYSEPMPAGPLDEVIALTEAEALPGGRRMELTIYSEERIYYSHTTRPQKFYDLWFGIPAGSAPSLGAAVEEIHAHGLVPLKGLFIGEPADNDALTLYLAQHFGARLSVVRSHDLFVEVTAPEASKGNALAFMAARLGVPREQVIAVGDSGNDVSMVQWAGLGVAMANATPDVHAAADWIAPPVSEDGAVEVIERFLL